MGRYKFKNRKYPKDFQSVCDYIKEKKGVVVKLGHITSFMGHFNRTIFIHHNYDLTNNGLYALLHEVGHALQPPTAVGSNSYKNIDDDTNKREFEMGRFVNELNAWEIGLSIANKLKIPLDKDDWNSQKNEALLTYWPKKSKYIMTNGEDILSKYRKGNCVAEFPTISEHDFELLKETYPKDTVKEMMAELFMEYPIPYADITEEDAYNDFLKLKGFRWGEYLKEGEWFPRKAAESKYPLTYDGKQQYFSRINTGNRASNYFQQHNRWSVDGSVSPGPKRTWETKAFMVSLMGAAYSLKLPQVGKKELRTMIGLRKYICAQFKPNVAKMFYDMNNAKTVLDFSMGWGDRLAGAFSSETVEHYVGLDPRKENHPIYEQQRDFYTKHTSFFETPTKTNFYESPAEDFNYDEYNDYFDVVFTSPPYFSVERYSHDDTQSWVRYKNINDWNKNFLHTTLGKIIPTVKKGGIIAINIADVYASSKGDKGWLEICNPMIEYLTSKGLTYKGCIGMEMAKRPNSGGAGTAKDGQQYSEESLKLAEETKNQTFCEPVWICQK